ncbi:MAG: ABC transporter ATP-binding protein [Myxococcales bacterium]|nr:ABC transporter ATP-binding protein [Myxococcales bacterium]
MRTRPILTVADLQTSFFTDNGEVQAVDHLYFQLREGQSLGIVGESGSGKSVTCLSVLKLLPMPPARIVGGKVLYHGKLPGLPNAARETVDYPVAAETLETTPPGVDLVTLSEKGMRAIRGDRIAMIFQDPMTSLNPFLRVQTQLTEVLRLHRKMTKADARSRSQEMLKKVGIPDPDKVMETYPHQLSGGMRQRVMIAMALLCDPQLLIADEPTTALDVTIQAQILELIRELRDQFNTAVVMITHDLGVVAGIADHVLVMYAGRVMESAPCDEIFESPQHPYTLALLRSIPTLDSANRRLYAIPGLPPDLTRKPPGCPFAPRCEFAFDRCRAEFPPLRYPSPTHKVACWLEQAPTIEGGR